jgi:large subunit ribosomal protein L54
LLIIVPSAKSKKQRRLAAKRLRKAELRDPDALAPKVPLYEQSIDLPVGNGTVQGAVQAAVAREELKKAMRVKRRADIKEGNFLKTMG